MNIKNKYSLWDKLYSFWEYCVLHKIGIDQNKNVDYLVYFPSKNEFSWMDDWQLSKNKETIWFKEDKTDGKNKTV